MHKRPSNSIILSEVKEIGSISEYARLLGFPRSTVSDWVVEARAAEERHEAGDYERKSYLITSAQIGTPVDKNFMENLEAMAEVHNAEILIPCYTYNKNGMGYGGEGAAEKKLQAHYFDPLVRPYMMNERRLLNKKVEVLGNLNILPTAVNPLSGYQSFTQDKSGVFPHPKIMSESVATSPDKMCKFLFTTGSCTVPNYMQKNAGIKAEFFHEVGAVLVEIVNNKVFHHRHVLAEKDGSFYDLTDRYSKGELTQGHRLSTVNWGDIHRAQIAEEVYHANWFNMESLEGTTHSLMDILKPKYQFFHDLLDFKFRNHHNRNDHLWLSAHLNKSVQEELYDACEFLEETQEDYCQSVIVSSNHDRAYSRWVKEVDASEEPNLDNKIFLLWSQLAMFKNTKAGIGTNMFATYAFTFHGLEYGGRFKFLNPDESFKVKGVENGMHGDRGIGGSRGSIKSYSKIGTRSTIGHSHSSGIYEGVYQNGCSRTYPAEYSEGPCANSYTHTIQYKNGKRTQLTLIPDHGYMKRIPKLAKL